MNITYDSAKIEDVERVYQLCEQLIHDYEIIDRIDLDRVLRWVRKKIANCINEYTTVFVDGKKAGYYHFYKNEDGEYEIDDLYIFPEFQNQGIGSSVIRKCCSEVDGPVMLYVFIKNHRAVSLYKRLGFDVVETVNDSRYIMKNDNNSSKYYAAYDERYKTAHAHGVSWSSDVSTPIVMEVIEKENMPAGRQHQKWMLNEILRLQCDSISEKPTFELDENKVMQINELLVRYNRINDVVTKSRITGGRQ
mgnify:CR=1 FL=1